MISDNLLTKTLDYFDKHKNEREVVKPSLPILYFGDLDAYQKSELKIITVGKNPSDNEFRLNKEEPFSFIRFPKWCSKQRNLIKALNPYFEHKPLQWFSCFEPILNGATASYYQKKGYSNIALHTDICSPLATNPTWSKLSPETQKLLFTDGFEIWKQLVNELQPDIIFVSIPIKLFKDAFKPNSQGQLLIEFKYKKDGTPRKKPYRVELFEYTLNNKKKVKVVFGQAANTPFGTISDKQKNEIGELCLK
ncbi:MAG: hypothetical protein KatS3mg031_3156 [Chitinophagales bacterium]|nr:MAG: hypothetical protein KatS3mg031_3156 [Chitinophagales bacterium]